MQFRLRIRHLARPAGDDDETGDHLVEVVRESMARGGGGPVAVVVRARRTELVALQDLPRGAISVPSFVAGLANSAPAGEGPALAVGLAGRFLYRPPAQARDPRPDSGAPVAMVFLEWPDCRWWHWRVVLDGDGRELPDAESRHRAVDGDPLPGGLGRWWSLARRTGAAVRFDPPVDVARPESPLVH